MEGLHVPAWPIIVASWIIARTSLPTPPPPNNLCHAGTNYVETLRVQVHANCRIRRIYFSDRLYSEEELPPEFKLFLPVQKQAAAA